MKKFLSMAVILLTALSSVSAQRKTDVWDFGGVAQDGADNHITTKDIDAIQILNGGKYSDPGDIDFGDVTVNVVANDRAYYDGKKNYGSQGYASYDFGDGYVSNGIYYCNGSGGDNRRYILIRNVKAGDTVTFYARLSAAADTVIHFTSVNDNREADGKQDETAPVSAESKKYSYIASVSGSYKIWTDKKAGKPVFYRVVRTPGVELTGNLINLNGKGELKFVIKETNQSLDAVITGNTYKAGLAAGHQYTALLTGIQGYGISAQNRIVDLTSAKNGEKIKLSLEVSEAKTYKAHGKIEGFDKNYDVSNLGLTMTPPEGSFFQSVEAKVTNEGGVINYTAELEPGCQYTAVLTGANDYAVSKNALFDSLINVNQDITVNAKPVYEVSGSFFGEAAPLPSAISFKNMEDSYLYRGIIEGSQYKALLREGTYEVICETEKARTINHIIVTDKAVVKDVKLSLKDKTLTALPLKKDIKVGPKEQYKTVNQALKAAMAMNPQSEKDRITIHIAPGVYREQVKINVPYITLKNDTPSQEVKLTWYYGVGYMYYSADENGWYDEDLAYDKFAKHPVSSWGGATHVMAGATSFMAEGITFETSFNKYITDDELTDGVKSDGSIGERKINSDVRSKALTERSAAILIEGVRSQFLNCKFMGSQDTLYTGYNSAAAKSDSNPYKNEPLRTYFRNCFINGNTDFIFGDGDAVFEDCEISFAGYTTQGANGGYITAARTTSPHGYLFYNCVVSSDQNYYSGQGYLGRPWGKDAKVAFINTTFAKVEMFKGEGWTQMSGNAPEKACFREYGTIDDGKPADLNDRIEGTVIKSAEGYTPEAYLGDWVPEYSLLPKKAGKVKFSKKPSFTTDDDINTPYPGHTVTLHYSLGKADDEDVSLISWYSVKDGNETLIRQTKGFADKTLLITKDEENTFIKAVVTPVTRSGKNGESAQITLEAKVREGYSAPSKAVSDRPRTAGAVNIFLAGDSTVMDYSAQGMYTGGRVRSEGAWGEYLQAFFNSSVAVQNYAQGGRSTRNFINEGTLSKIADNIDKGDYLFIQFGHNDCANGLGYLEDRYVPLGKPDSNGIYPSTPGKKTATPASYQSKYGNEFYGWEGGTYKWYLKQYIKTAKDAGAVPVLVTPVSRLYFNPDGTIRPHHDSTEDTKGTFKSEGNAYCEAVRQTAQEENVLLIDGFELTKKFYEDSYKAAGNNDTLARKLMFPGDSTHNNKLGGFILAGEFAKAIKEQIPALGKCLKKPSRVLGENADNANLFTVGSNSDFTCDDEYWTQYEQTVINSICK